MSVRPPVWYGVMDMNGEVHLDASRGWHAYKQTLRGKRIEVVMKVWRPKASRKQHGWYRGCALPMIAAEMGHLEYEYPAVHDALMRELFGLKEGCDPRLKIRYSTADMNTAEFTEKMMETVQVWAATTLGLVIPDPDPERVVKRKGAYKRRAA
jgi:hypothetical protein